MLLYFFVKYFAFEVPDVFELFEVRCCVLTYSLPSFIRHKANNRKETKIDDYPLRKQNKSWNLPCVADALEKASSNEGLIDDTKSLSKSVIGGSMNVGKIRSISFWFPERVIQGKLD